MTRRDQFPAFLQKMLESPPHAGEGVHDWLFRVARQLHAHIPALEIVSLLENRIANCGRFVPRSEIVSAVQNSLPCAWQPGNQAQPIHAAPKWPSVNQEQREAIIHDGGGLVDLWENSPVRFDDNTAHTEALIDALFPGDPLLYCGLSNSDFWSSNSTRAVSTITLRYCVTLAVMRRLCAPFIQAARVYRAGFLFTASLRKRCCASSGTPSPSVLIRRCGHAHSSAGCRMDSVTMAPGSGSFF
jgi:hypothetical protein